MYTLSLSCTHSISPAAYKSTAMSTFSDLPPTHTLFSATLFPGAQKFSSCSFKGSLHKEIFTWPNLQFHWWASWLGTRLPTSCYPGDSGQPWVCGIQSSNQWAELPAVHDPPTLIPTTKPLQFGAHSAPLVSFSLRKLPLVCMGLLPTTNNVRLKPMACQLNSPWVETGFTKWGRALLSDRQDCILASTLH